MLLGVSLAGSLSDVSWMRMVCENHVSIVGLLPVLLLPFLLSAMAVFLSQTWLLYVIGFFKAFSFGFCCALTQFAFGDSGWLIRLLLFFSDSWSLPLLCWFCLRHLDGQLRTVKIDLAACLGLTIFFALMDSWMVAPFLASLINF